MGPFWQRHNYKNPIEEGTQTNVCWDLIYAGIGPIMMGVVQRDDPYHRRHCASPAIVTARHCRPGPMGSAARATAQGPISQGAPKFILHGP